MQILRFAVFAVAGGGRLSFAAKTSMAPSSPRKPLKPMPSWERLSQWEIENITLPMQRSLSFLDLPAKLLGVSISGEAILPVFACLYWCFDQQMCFCGIWLVPLSEMANGFVKWRTLRGRPAWVDPRVRLGSWSSEYSFPSSHSQLSAAIMTWLVLSSSHTEAVIQTPALPAAAYALLVAASRVHEGLHFPSDAAVGCLWGSGAELYNYTTRLAWRQRASTRRSRAVGSVGYG